MKKISLILLVAIVCIIGYSIYVKFAVYAPSASPVISSTTKTTSTVSNTQQPVPVSGSYVNWLQDGVSLEKLGALKNATTGIIISFEFLPADAPNSAASVLLGSKQIGQIGGSNVAIVGFSPDNNYLALEWEAIMGAGSNSYGVSVIDIQNQRILKLKPRIDSPAYPGGPTYPNGNPDPNALDAYIHSAVWSGPHSIDISSYLLWSDHSKASNTTMYYRMSPEETWRYNLESGSSTLVRTIP